MVNAEKKILDFICSLEESQGAHHSGLADEPIIKLFSRIIGMIPLSGRSGNVLHIMAYPYFLSALISKVTNHHVIVMSHGEEAAFSV